MDKVIVIKPLLVPIGPAWANTDLYIPIGEVFTIDVIMEDRIIAYNQDHRIALFPNEYEAISV